ncbi:putative secreted protein (Por secretion system target) [Lacibacter cauensis]|uniref:Putative secreted protein (Por secretion system target) n=1 Tax=Lacibacter cauensis TaxID=510947 RepID=A0A562SJ26_9BACT|nr:T9SS type A sorting domain-containing protein [Lacibacter cauensis]TWI81261.1 putative secreted protein (Por secretion system target) [Lacibacter cauensis]
MTKNILTPTLLSFIIVFNAHAQVAGDFQSKNTSGNWSDFNSWNVYNGSGWQPATAGQLPTAVTAVYVQVGHTVTVDNTSAVCNDLSISNGGTTGRLAFAATGTLNVKGTITLNSSGSNYFSPWAAGGKLIFSGSGSQGIIGLTAGSVFVQVEINKPSGAVTTSTNFRFENFTLTAGDFIVGTGNEMQGVSSTSAITINGGSWTQVAGTTRINVAGVAGSPIGPLVINGGSMTLATSNTTGGFNFSSIAVTNNGTLNLNNFNGNISITNSLGVDAASTLNIALPNFILPASVNFSGVVNYNHTGAQTIPAAAYTYLRISGSGVKTLGAGTTSIPANGILEMSGVAPSPTLALGGNTLAVSSDATTLIYASAAAQTATANEWNSGFYNVVINNASGVSMAGLSRSISGTLTLTSGTFNIGAAGSLTLDGAALVRTAGFLSGTNTSDFTVTGTAGGVVSIPQSGNIALRNVTIGGTRTVLLNGINAINLSGVFSIGSTAIVDNGGESQLLQNTGGSIVIDGRFITRDAEGFTGTGAAIPGITPVLNTGCTIEYGLLGNQVFNARSDYKNLVFSGSGRKTLSSGCIPTGTVFITGDAILETLNFTFGDMTTNLAMDGGRFRLAGTGTKPDIQGTYSLTGGVIEFFGGTPATSQTIRGSASIYYYNIEINSAYVANSNGNINLAAGGSFVIKSGAVFTINDESITGSTGMQTVTIETGARFVCGDADGFSGGSGTTSTSIRSDVENIHLALGSTIEYARTSAQVFSARSDYKNVIISGGGEKTLNGPSMINGILTLTSGLVTTTSANLLTLSATATCPEGGNSLSFVNGPMTKIGNSAFVFPVGKPELSGSAGGGFRLMGISAPVQITDAFTAEFIVGSATALGPISAAAASAGLTRVSRCEYWKLDRTAGSSSVNVTLSWNARSNCNVSYVSSLPDLAIAHFNTSSNSWDAFGADSWTGDVTAGTVTWNNVSAFSPFSLASTDFLENLLPVGVSDFQARSRSTDILLNWSMNSPTEPSYFELEKGKNGFSFQLFKKVIPQSGSFTKLYTEFDGQPFNGWNYYRLRTVDKQGGVTLSPVIKVWFGSNQQVKISPNPATEKIVIFFSQPSSITEIAIVNISGQVLQRIPAIQFNNEVNISHLQAGMYYVQIMGKNGLTTTSFIKQ